MEKLDTKKKSKYIQGIGEIKCRKKQQKQKQENH
jgi:hypothetical protein